jgi:hypothetical protein
VTYDMNRTGRLVPPPQGVPMIPGPSFRAVRRVVYDKVLLQVPALAPFFTFVLKLDASAAGDVPIPTNGKAIALATDIDFEPQRTHTVATTSVTYSVDAPKPFCATGPYDFVKLVSPPLTPLQFTLSVSTGPSGRYERIYSIGGTLDVTPLPSGSTLDASVFEIHHATMDDRNAQVTERTQQSLLGNPFQTMAWSFAAGDTDRFVRNVVCGTE